MRDAMALHGSAVQQLVEDDLRPIKLRDFQARYLRLFLACSYKV